MTVWTRAHALLLCGYCGGSIAKASPVLMRPVGPRMRPRCVLCAGEPVPDDLPPLAELSPIRPTRKASLAPLFLKSAGMSPVRLMVEDWKLRQAGREPGEDDDAA